MNLPNVSRIRTALVAVRILALLLLLLPTSAAARNLLIQGGTLIDGTGRAPLTNASVLIEGNVIQRVWSGDAPAVWAAELRPPGQR